MTFRAYDAGLAEADQEAHLAIPSTNLQLFNGRKASHPLNIVVVGCGLGGLAAAFALGHAGHRVTVLESAPAIGEIGAGIQVTPNLSRLLVRWGLGEVLKKIVVKPEAIALRRYNTGELVGWTQWGDKMERDHGSPYYHIHRADFHRLLLSLASPFMSLQLSSTVSSVNPSVPSLTLSSGDVISCDLIVGCDGVKSLLREVVLGEPVKATPTGDAAYRAIIPTEKMMKDSELRELVEKQEMTGWMGPSRHIMAYCIRAKREYNLVLLHPDDGSVESWTEEGSADKMRADFADFEPRVQKMLAMVPSTLKWKLMDRSPLPTWIHPEGKVVLLGDACHPMLPYRAQGAAMAVEDAAVLGNLFSHVSQREDVIPLLRGYEQLRLARTAATQASSRLNQYIFHLPDGPEQEARDASMRVARDTSLRKATGAPMDLNSLEGAKGSANQWADEEKNREQFGYDADTEAENWWREVGERQCRPFGEVSARM